MAQWPRIALEQGVQGMGTGQAGQAWLAAQVPIFVGTSQALGFLQGLGQGQGCPGTFV